MSSKLEVVLYDYVVDKALVVLNLKSPRGKRMLTIGVITVLLIAGSLIVLRYAWLPSVDDNGLPITHRFQIWVDSRSYEFRMVFDFYPSESSAVEENDEARFSGVSVSVQASDDGHYEIYVIDIPKVIATLWLRIQVVSDAHSPTNPVITDHEIGIMETVNVGDYEMSYLMTPFQV